MLRIPRHLEGHHQFAGAAPEKPDRLFRILLREGVDADDGIGFADVVIDDIVDAFAQTVDEAGPDKAGPADHRSPRDAAKT